MKRFSLLLIAAAMLSSGVMAQSLKVPALSPTTKISQDFSLSNIEISYSRPSMRGRKIFGDLVAYDHVWRTGANAPTKIKTGEDLLFAGHKVKAGEYLLYTIPGRDNWEVVLSSATSGWSETGYPREFDVARFRIKPLPLGEECQTFTIMVTDITYNTCKLELTWERTKVTIPVEARNEATVEENIDKAVNNPVLPYFQAATYYYETNQKMDLAKGYVDKALDQNPKGFYIWYLKAKIEKKLGNVEEATAAAKKSIELSEGSALAHEYKHNNEKLLQELNRYRRSHSPGHQ